MYKRKEYQINISAPNLINICVDENCSGRLSGRLYHCYTKEAVAFSDLVELLRDMEQLFDSISFPQASNKTRSFIEKEPLRQERPEKAARQEDIIQHRGVLGTFVTLVKFRQSSTWQGEMICMETGVKNYFSNTLDFIKRMDQALGD